MSERKLEQMAEEYAPLDERPITTAYWQREGFKAGFKAALALPALKEVFKTLEFYGNEDNWQDPDSYVPYWTLWSDGANVGFNEAQNALSKIKALGIVKEGEK